MTLSASTTTPNSMALNKSSASGEERVAEVFCFPLSRRAALVQETKSLVERKPPDAAARFWRMTVRRLRVELATYRLPNSEIDHQLEDFAHVVLRPAHSSTSGDDAA